MTKLSFRNQDGRPVAGAVVAITAAPAEVTDLGYVTDDKGAITLTLPAEGDYRFVVTAADGTSLTAHQRLQPNADAELTADAT